MVRALLSSWSSLGVDHCHVKLGSGKPCRSTAHGSGCDGVEQVDALFECHSQSLHGDSTAAV